MFNHEKQNLLEAIGLGTAELISVTRAAARIVEEALEAVTSPDGSLNITAVLAASKAAVLAMMEHNTVGIAVLAVSSFKELVDLDRQEALAPSVKALLGGILSSLGTWGVDFRKKGRTSEMVEALCETVPKPVLIDKTLALFCLLMMEKSTVEARREGRY